MIEIPKTSIDELLHGYNRECIKLLRASADYPQAEGVFRADSAYYLNKPLTHFSGIEAQICFNQLCFTALGYWIKTGVLEEDYASFVKDRFSSIYLLDTSLRFKKEIDPADEIPASLDVKKIRKRKNIFFAFVDFEFDNGSFQGSSKLAWNKYES